MLMRQPERIFSVIFSPRLALTRADGGGRKQRNRETSNFTPVEKRARRSRADGKKENERRVYTRRISHANAQTIKARASVRFHRGRIKKN